MSIFRVQQTKLGKIDRLIKLATQNKFYFAFGKATDWDSSWGEGINDTNPPAPDENATEIPEPFLLIKAFRASPVTEKECTSLIKIVDDVQIGAKTFRVLDKEELPTDLSVVSPSYLFVEGAMESKEFTSYRTIGLFLNPTFNTGVDLNKLSFVPSEVNSYGVLYNSAYCTPVTSSATISKVQFIITL